MTKADEEFEAAWQAYSKRRMQEFSERDDFAAGWYAALAATREEMPKFFEPDGIGAFEAGWNDCRKLTLDGLDRLEGK